ncbi:hypothetical protein BX600DRAFT_241981 [Xylariales sp. PMI_506]|nr:hypothetical protein BX600DRAFT_241981 [Xylariales sp. PMI_506]
MGVLTKHLLLHRWARSLCPCATLPQTTPEHASPQPVTSCNDRPEGLTLYVGSCVSSRPGQGTSGHAVRQLLIMGRGGETYNACHTRREFHDHP